jgi:glucose-1-phosphate thymidylyltransferase
VRIIILYAGLEDREQNWPDHCSLALQRLAGSNVLGHILNQLRDLISDEITLIVERDADAISDWAAQNLPGLDIDFVTAIPGIVPLQALAACRRCFDQEPLLLVLGSHIVEAEFKDLYKATAGVTLFIKPVEDTAAHDPAQERFSWAGACYFRHGAVLGDALDRALPAGQANLAGCLTDLYNSDLAVDLRPATLSLDAGTIDGLLFANARLLGLGYGSDDAIERSYVEDFTVIPPVFLHETAEIENSVVGPFTNVEAGARISSSVVRNSLLGRDSAVHNVVLDGSIIGPRARLESAGAALIVEEGTEVTK